MIGVDGFREQLYKTDDRLEKADLWQSETAELERLKREAQSYRSVLDYAYEMHKIPGLAK